MSLRQLVKVGRRWINPWFIIEVEDCARPSPPPGPAPDRLNLTILAGRTIHLVGDDAREMRRLLGDGPDDDPGADEAEPAGGPPPGPSGDEGDDDEGEPPEVLTGRGPIPLVRGPAEARQVAE